VQTTDYKLMQTELKLLQIVKMGGGENVFFIAVDLNS
jgi:hypothetical protein